MLEIKALTDAILVKLRAIASLTQVLGGEGAIYAYQSDSSTYRNITEAINSQARPSAMLIYGGTIMGDRGGFRQWRHQWFIYLRTDDEETALRCARFILDEPPVGDEQAWPDLEIDPECDSPEEISLGRSVNDDGIEFYQIAFSLQEIGG